VKKHLPVKRGGRLNFLETKNISKSFGGLHVIEDISFTLQEGETLGIIGPNGSGKTTLFNLISGFLKPNKGNITFLDKDITNKNSASVCKEGIARTFQLVRPFPQLTTLENVTAGSAYGSNPAKTLKIARKEADEIVDMVGLGSKKMVIAGQLSLIDRKRLEIARALATKPKLLLLDEVFAGLNHAEVEEALRLLTTIRGLGITLMIVEHVIKVILGISDRVIVINSGGKIFEGLPKDAINDIQVCKAYLGENFCA
jgi:branched-chain amino acid transport system ATP-binding protein